MSQTVQSAGYERAAATHDCRNVISGSGRGGVAAEVSAEGVLALFIFRQIRPRTGAGGAAALMRVLRSHVTRQLKPAPNVILK